MRISLRLTAALLSVLTPVLAAAQQTAAPKPATPAAPVAAPQKPAAPAAAPATQVPKPAAPAGTPATPPAAVPAAPRVPSAPAAAAAAARTAMLLTVTDPTGHTLPGVKVSLSGPLTREGNTDDSGQLRFTGVRPGTYRARFSSEQVVTFEREVIVLAGKTSDVDVTLSAAEARPAPAPPPPPPAPVVMPAPVGPAGQPRAVSLVDLAEKELIGKNVPRRETLVSCSGNTRTTLLQLNQEQPQRVYEGAESVLYVIAGDGLVKLGGRDVTLTPGTLVSVPRGTAYVLNRRGSRPLILLSVLAGEPCEQAQ